MIDDLFPHGLHGIIYDCDGVMIDSRSANTLFYNRVLAHFGLPPMTPEQEMYSFMATGMQALEHILPVSLHPQIKEVVRTAVNYDRDIVPLLTLMPGFKDFVLEIHGLGLRQAICTNRTSQGFGAVLQFFKFPKIFEPIVTVSSSPPKPNSQGAKSVTKQWGCEPGQILFVGDSAHDRDAARGAGQLFAAFNGLGIQGDITCANYGELRSILAPHLGLS
ncbi:MAG: HAD family hydrolase [Desulfovibrio sp.]|nr:HAD family hydrolase [Desulfovibrio sp.]